MSNVADVKPKKRTVDLGDGVEREVVLSLNAMAELEDKYGSIDNAFEKIKKGSIATIRFLLWCVLVPDGDTDLTEREIGRLIKLDNIQEIMTSVMDALEDQMPPSADSPNQQTQADVIPLPNSGW